MIASVNQATCAGCFSCEGVCAYKAIEPFDIKDKEGNLIRRVAQVNKGKCLGCGACAATCRSNSIQISGFTDSQIFAQIHHIKSKPLIIKPFDEGFDARTHAEQKSRKAQEELHEEEPALVSHRERS